MARDPLINLSIYMCENIADNKKYAATCFRCVGLGVGRKVGLFIMGT